MISKFRSVASILTGMKNFFGELSLHFQFKLNILCIFRVPADGNRKDRSRVNVGTTQLLLLYPSISHYMYYEVHFAQVG